MSRTMLRFDAALMNCMRFAVKLMELVSIARVENIILFRPSESWIAHVSTLPS